MRVRRNRALRLMAMISVYTLLLGFAGQLGAQSNAQQAKYDAAVFKGLEYRNIGPFRGGRSTACVGVPSQPNVFYFGATGGGVWKTVDGGANWDPISDGFFKTGSVGAIAVADSDPNIVYVGMGESPIRGNVSHGDGVYKSMDAGKTWKHMGLDDTRQISRVRVNPKNPDIVYVAALGHVWAPNDQRGVFRSKDGGKTWDRILFKGNKAGATDLIIDPTNSNVIYAAFWEVYRTPWDLESGGPNSGIFKSTDGGDTWTELTKNPGMPKGTIGNIGISVSPVNPDRVWALVEAEEGGVFRSDNGGKTWVKTNEQRDLRQRAWYYTKIYADPMNLDTVYVLNVSFYKSNDGGRTFANMGEPHGDNHDLWISPNDSNRMINSNDGGATISFNGGKTWSTQDNQPTAQFYRVLVDNDFPYNVYGAQQDNSTVRIPSRTTGFGIDRTDWYDVGGGESGWIAPDPKDSQIVYAGSYGGLITRVDHRTGQVRNINPWPDNPMGWAAGDLRYRFQWNFPITFSPFDSKTMYTGANVLFKTANEGQTWTIISPDLTRNDKAKQASSGGPITKDNTSIEYYDTIFTVMESPVQRDLIWVGSDDGVVHVTRDGGKKWDDVTPKGIPEWIQINSLDASPFEAGTAYVAATMYKFDDYKPYLYKTNDFGKTWKKITNGIPDGAFTRVIREDPNRKGLLYAGTETGMYVSFDDGENWQPLQLNLPVVPVTDLTIDKKNKGLVVATQGRAFWILDDLSVLHEMKDEVANSDLHLFHPEDAYRMPGGGGFRARGAVGSNPPGGAVIDYYFKSKPAGDVTLEFFDADGKSIRRFTSRAAGPGEDAQGPGGGRFGGGGPQRIPADAGLNRFVWNMRYADAVRFPGMILWAGNTTGPLIVPGTYKVKLTVGDKSETQTFEVKKDPRIATTVEEFIKQRDLLIQLRDKFSDTSNAIIEIRDIRKQIDEVSKRAQGQPNGKPIVDAAKSLSAKLTAIEEELYQTKNQSSQDPLNYPIRLNNKLAALAGVVADGDYAPTDQSYSVQEDLTGKIDVQLQKFGDLKKGDIPAFNKLVRDQDVPAVIVKGKPGTN